LIKASRSPYRELAEKYEVSITTISEIKSLATTLTKLRQHAVFPQR
jgi:hypothetical protein